MKGCVVCKEEKPITSFVKRKNGTRKDMCRACKNKRTKENKKQKEKQINKKENIIGKKGKVKVKHISGKWATTVSLEEAHLLFEIGCAAVVSESEIIFSNMRRLKQYMLERDNYCCVFCGEYGDTLDHMRPQKRGGEDIPSNVLTSCKECNEEKSDRKIAKFLKEDERRWENFISSGYANKYPKIVSDLEKIVLTNKKRMEMEHAT